MCPKITKISPKLLQNCKNPGFFPGNACHFRKFFLFRARLRFFCEFSKILGQGNPGTNPHGTCQEHSERGTLMVKNIGICMYTTETSYACETPPYRRGARGSRSGRSPRPPLTLLYCGQGHPASPGWQAREQGPARSPQIRGSGCKKFLLTG